MPSSLPTQSSSLPGWLLTTISSFAPARRGQPAARWLPVTASDAGDDCCLADGVDAGVVATRHRRRPSRACPCRRSTATSRPAQERDGLAVVRHWSAAGTPCASGLSNSKLPLVTLRRQRVHGVVRRRQDVLLADHAVGAIGAVPVQEQQPVLGRSWHHGLHLDRLAGVERQVLVVVEVDLRVAEQRQTERVGSVRRPARPCRSPRCTCPAGSRRSTMPESPTVMYLRVDRSRTAAVRRMPATRLPARSFSATCSVYRCVLLVQADIGTGHDSGARVGRDDLAEVAAAVGAQASAARSR